jgi:hypothetical protein
VGDPYIRGQLCGNHMTYNIKNSSLVRYNVKHTTYILLKVSKITYYIWPYNEMKHFLQWYFPCKLGDGWILYTWNLDENEITVFDTSKGVGDGGTNDLWHIKMTSRLKTSMTSAANALFDTSLSNLMNATVKLAHGYAAPK